VIRFDDPDDERGVEIDKKKTTVGHVMLQRTMSIIRILDDSWEASTVSSSRTPEVKIRNAAFLCHHARHASEECERKSEKRTRLRSRMYSVARIRGVYEERGFARPASRFVADIEHSIEFAIFRRVSQQAQLGTGILVRQGAAPKRFSRQPGLQGDVTALALKGWLRQGVIFTAVGLTRRRVSSLTIWL